MSEKKPRKAPVRHKNDPELLRYAALGRIFEQMAGLDEQERAIAWVRHKFGRKVTLDAQEAPGRTISPPEGS